VSESLPGHAVGAQPGDIVAHYRLVERLGRDNDTMIYRARDLRLDRDVAVKLLSPEHGANPRARERFRREAHIASLVSHPHICAVHDSGEENGQAFLVCELLEGRALDEAIAAGALPPERLLDLAIQLVDGIAAVHRRGLVHGNIKPSNIFVTDDGHVKVLELGLMSAWWDTYGHPDGVDSSSPTASADQRAPADADIEGFHAYRSPEHLAGERLDHRSDIFSIGAVIYEMATGERAFPGDTPTRIAAAIVSGTPTPAGAPGPSLAAVEPIIHKALEKDPAHRYQSASDLLADLRRARRRVDVSGSTIAGVRPGRRRLVLAGAAAATLAAMAGGWWWWRHAHPAGPVERHALLVGSIANGTNDPDFDGTLRQALTVHLGQSPFLDIVSDDRLRQMLQMMGREPGAPVTHATAREACERLQAGALIEGSVSAVGRATVVALVASDCTSGDTIARDQVEVERKEDVLKAVGRIASSMRRSLGESVGSLERHNVPIQEATTPSLEALKAFTAGVDRRAAGGEIESIPYFERAIQLDRNFALAYTTLSSIYGGLGETGRGEEYARLAYEHRGTVSERERLFIAYQYHDRVTGDQLKTREALEVWKQAYPLDYRPGNALAVLLNRLGDYDRSIVEAQDAMRLNPGHPFPYSNLAYAFRGAGRYAEAKRTAERAVSLGIETVPTRRLLYQLAEMSGDRPEAQRHLDWARGRPRGFDLIGAHAQVTAFRGVMAEARRLFQLTMAEATRNQLGQIASGYSAQLALTDALFGYASLAAERARRIPVDTTYEPQLRAATALALAGAAGDAEKWIARMREFRPSDTLLHGAYLPVADAASLIARDRMSAAVEALRPAAPYERGTVAALLPMYFRAEARRRAGAFVEAARDFRAVIANRGAEPFSPTIPMAHLGLGRALAAAGDFDGSRRAYDDLFEIWQNADADLPALVQARAEAAVLAR
jgi:eukaryotic-like serine/threonine-protein kinase